MMKKIMITTLSLLPMLSMAQTFVIEGKINMDSLPAGKIYLSYEDNGEQMRDSSDIVNKAYHFKGSMHDGAIRAFLSWEDRTQDLKKRSKGFSQFYVSPGNVAVTHNGKFTDPAVTGSAVENDSRHFTRYASTYKEAQVGFIKSHPDSWLSVVFLEEMVIRTRNLSLDETDTLIAALSTNLRKYDKVKELKALNDGRRSAIAGNKAIEFSAPDVNGKMITLSSYRGKYVFIDFWASWCHPCREENPNVTAAYEKFKDKGLNILSVSLDAQRDAWLKAVKQDKLAWPQVSNLKGFKDEAAVKYGVHAIPENFLIDPQGNIVAKGLHGEALHKKLEEIFSK